MSIEGENRRLRAKLDDLTRWATQQVEEARHPEPYMDSMHYLECDVKARVLDDLLVHLKEKP